MRQKNKICSDGRGVENGQKIYLCAPLVEGDGASESSEIHLAICNLDVNILGVSSATDLQKR